MNQNVYQILQSMQAYIYQQDKVLRDLQKKIQTIEETVSDLKKRPSVKVERMEYKFDQLKVETLEGTLNIGLNPSDLQAIEDFSVPGNNGTIHPKERMSMFTEIESSINEYLDSNLQSIMGDTSEPLEFPVDDTYRDFILQDIKKQLSTRIEYYLNQPLRDGSTEEQQKEWIIEQLKKEIQHGVLTFLQNLPENMKGAKTGMNFEVVNRDICVGSIHVLGVSSSSLLMVGDTNSIQLTSLFDTPPESLIIGPFVPLTPMDNEMLKRISKVNSFKLDSLGSCLYSFKLVIQTKLTDLTRALAVQRQREYFLCK